MNFVDDALREQLAETLHYQLRPEGVPWPGGEGPATKRMYALADALLPLIREQLAQAWSEGWHAGDDFAEAMTEWIADGGIDCGRERPYSINPHRQAIWEAADDD